MGAECVGEIGRLVAWAGYENAPAGEGSLVVGLTGCARVRIRSGDRRILAGARGWRGSRGTKDAVGAFLEKRSGHLFAKLRGVICRAGGVLTDQLLAVVAGDDGAEVKPVSLDGGNGAERGAAIGAESLNQRSFRGECGHGVGIGKRGDPVARDVVVGAVLGGEDSLTGRW